jgi:hypothetical protein
LYFNHITLPILTVAVTRWKYDGHTLLEVAAAYLADYARSNKTLGGIILWGQILHHRHKIRAQEPTANKIASDVSKSQNDEWFRDALEYAIKLNHHWVNHRLIKTLEAPPTSEEWQLINEQQTINELQSEMKAFWYQRAVVENRIEKKPETVQNVAK